ncbi:MAG: cyclic beta 1-2 glucan synthetase [Spirochaetae bacterium HGW-Spirochaetae-1]|jgi:cellobiose phosphorylase|nr:MAG: cyclic beta 1-2 glucan synthetase [Spirochaetae bacterium HGW-Spirochaetae-1]
MNSRKNRNLTNRIKTLLFNEEFPQKYAGGPPPLRSTLFSAEQMDKHGKIIAGIHILRPETARNQDLLSRLTENESILLEVQTLLSEAVRENRRITPAGEWLLDNFYLIEEHIQTGRKHLPKGYSRELPCLQNGQSAGLPRVYDIAMELISHGDGRVDPNNLTRFIASYQSISALKLGELWAIPIMLRLTLIENLRRVAACIAANMTEQDLAGYWADRMLDIIEKDAKSLILIVAEMAHSNPNMTSAFVAELSRRLQGQSSALALPLTWIEQQLSETGLTIKQLVHSEIQQQAADQVSISNSIGSLRFLSAMDWHEFVESMSIVDHTLREDPGGFYSEMDFKTRDRYRHVIEKVAKNSRLNITETEVAREAIQLAREGAENNGITDRTAHVGFYLIEKGFSRLERKAKIRLSPRSTIKKTGARFPLFIFLVTIMALTAIFTIGLFAKAHTGGMNGWMLILFTILTVLCTVHPAVALTNWLATLLVNPDLLPRMDFSEGIPSELRTLVVVPTMITSPENIADLVEALEVRFLANSDENVYFGLLTDLKDADKETLPEDELLTGLAREKIEHLNKKYHGSKGDSFFLFHRPRLWNSKERLWMGYERKRGKLADLNSLLRGGSEGHFSLIVGKIEILSSIKYVITLDTDTQLPRDSARQFVGAMAHPLNRARYDNKKKYIVEGYGIIQPRVAVILPAVNRSRYARLNGSESGIDPYTRVVSDVYQDLFHEGSFIGKGIYEVDSFEQALKDRLPENLILSHDLLEGCYARAGLLSDVQLYDEYPSNYHEDVVRRRRWIRGDWQIISWILPFVPGHDGHLRRNPVSLLSRWKIFDNLRRSLTPVALTLFILLGWIFQSPAWFWTLSAATMILVPSLFSTVLNLFRKPKEMLLNQHLVSTLRSAGMNFAQGLFTIVCLPYEAYYSTNAILRTGWRMLILHRRLLEWNPSGGMRSRASLMDSYLEMFIAPVIALTTMIYLAISNSSALPAALPILILWAASPAIAYWISRPISRREAHLSDEQNLFLRKLARKTWAYFEKFVGPEDNWLPPDNFQEAPSGIVAHRTSPTNIGLSLLANLTAYDFGYIPAGQLIERSGNTLDAMKKLEQHRGHFYNWYDTLTLDPLPPLYISTVDSGNLAGHLLVLKPGLIALPDHYIVNPGLFNGIADTLRICIDAAETVIPPPLTQFMIEIESVINTSPTTLTSARQCLERLIEYAEKTVSASDTRLGSESLWWAQDLIGQCRAALEELIYLAPWTSLYPTKDKLPIDQRIDRIPTLRELAQMEIDILPSIPYPSVEPEEFNVSDELRRLILQSISRATLRIADIERLADQAEHFALMEYDFLYDKKQHLLTIGYNVDQHRADSGYYDLLASEARLCSFIAIAQRQLPQESWFALGRLLTSDGSEPVLLSWSGSMFEYLMPLLVMPTYENTLLDQTYKAVIKRQIGYGKLRNVPWGISESGYNALGIRLDYQYRAFGVPGLGLKRGLADDLVIAPYASMLALMVAPEEAVKNLEQLSALKFEGRYGLYEAIDYTPSRLPLGQQHAVVKSYMSHHSGMSLLSLSYLLLNRPMQKRFEANPLCKAAMLLLQEKIPDATSLYLNAAGASETQIGTAPPDIPMRIFSNPDSKAPEVQLLSNGRYHVMVTTAGGGYSRWKDIAVTRWREDTTCDNHGAFCYIRDMESREYWSTAYQPTLKAPKNYEVIFSEGRAEFRRRDFDIDTYTSIVVSPEDDIELRRVRLTNFSKKTRTMEITSYAETVLAPFYAEALHPAFSNLFVQTEIVSSKHVILSNRRPRSIDEKTPWMFHVMTLQEGNMIRVSHETNRMQFIGRGNSLVNPRAICDPDPLKENEGSVLDPISAIRYVITLEPEESAVIDMVSGIGETREEALRLAEKYRDRSLSDRVFDLAWTHSQVVLRQLNITEAEAQLYGHLAGFIIHAHLYLRADRNIIKSNLRGQSGLWGYSISGDLPIVLLQIENAVNIDLVRQLVSAHAYWRLKGLAVDLVIWNDDHAGYRQILHEQILGLIAAGIESNPADRSGEIFVRNTDQISGEDQVLMQTVARAIITDRLGLLAEQITRKNMARMPVPQLVPVRTIRAEEPAAVVEPRTDLIHFNGYGGFTPDGREYITTTGQGQNTPAPWVNILANKNFGTVISESGMGYTWSENAHEFRLTPWDNDPVCDTGGEAFYIRDEERGHFWSPMPLPKRGSSPYVTRHGFGYSVFEHTERGISTEVWVYVALDASIKFTVVKIHNLSKRPRRLSLTGYTEWVLGDLRCKSSMHVVTRQDPLTGAIFAHNQFNKEFEGRTAFFDVDNDIRTITCDRTEFIGRNGTLREPAAMTKIKLSNRTGAALDPCAAIRVPFDLDGGEECEIIFRLGSGMDSNDANSLLRRFRGASAARGSLEAVWDYWKHTLGAVQVETPDQSLNVLANGWLIYQVLACRMWARSGYYQSGGAYGFRDQLQDAMAIIHTEPGLLREHLLLCAAHQFEEGDVQHWWHPPLDRGVRTHCSDDFLWLPLATARYILCTGDTGVLDEPVSFIKGRPVSEDEDSYYDLPIRSDETATLYDHCIRALKRAQRYGVHGLPLIGSGDWNDGMEFIGKHGKGESVWLAFFFYNTLMQFSKIAEIHNDRPFAEHCQTEAAKLRENIEANAWDGEWYRRAYFDDGTPLGSAKNAECQIDSIAQSWSILSGAGYPGRSRMAMKSLDRRLVRRSSSLVQLLDPPFDKSDLNPGYIKGYVPGVRENGGQYTHAAVWAAMAFAASGEGEKAWELMGMINPVNHGSTFNDIATYRVEPYVMAADVYGQAPHTGRGGWTWYTGSAGWMYRLIIESLLGLRLDKQTLHIEPCLHPDWKNIKVHYRYRETVYHISIIKIIEESREPGLTIDGKSWQGSAIPLVDDHKEHSVEVRIINT